MEYCDTSECVISKMIDMLGWRYGEYILEPSAGTGAIIKQLLNRYVAPNNILSNYIHFCELNAGRATKTTEATGAVFKDFDFLCYSLTNTYSRIIAVPPFNGLEWLDHTMKMYHHLKPGGKMIVLLPDRALDHKEFREWTTEKNSITEAMTEQACSYQCDTFILQITKP